ncbi:MAG: hypothetical protein ABFD89_17455 [Bryobacteraceae bacterium]
MIISKKYAQKLVREGKATLEPSTTVDDSGHHWQIVTRRDLQRVDHYQVD